MGKILLGFAFGYFYCQLEHHPSPLGLWAGVIGIGTLCIRVLTVWHYYREVKHDWSPAKYWAHHFNRHQEYAYDKCLQCHQLA